jgi:hypothetical protein
MGNNIDPILFSSTKLNDARVVWCKLGDHKKFNRVRKSSNDFKPLYNLLLHFCLHSGTYIKMKVIYSILIG